MADACTRQCEHRDLGRTAPIMNCYILRQQQLERNNVSQ